ncbi:MAG: hypothetical protein ACE5JJ_06285 [Nitrospinota bacterium]
MYRVKLTPITSARHARLAAEAGADALGFLVGALEPLPGRLTPEAARRLIAALPRGALAVMVTYATQPAVLESLLRRAGAHAIEARGEFSPAALQGVRRHLSGVPLACAIPLGPDACARARQLAPHADAFYLAFPEGSPPDWGRVRELGEAGGKKPLLLGGALEVEESIREAGAHGLDLAVEPEGRVELAALRRRVERARAALGAGQGALTPPARSPESPRA